MPSNQVYSKLSKLTKPLLEHSNPAIVYKSITKNICTLLKASASLLLLYENKKIRIACAYNLSPEYQRIAKADVAIAQAALEKQRTKFVRDIKQLYRNGDKNTLASIRKEGIISLVSAPLGRADTAVGCINIYYHRSLKSFKMTEALSFFVRLSTIAVIQARMTEKVEEKTKMVKGIEDIGSLFASSFEIMDMMNAILTTAVDIADADAGGLILIDETNKLAMNAYEYKRGTRRTIEYASTARLEEGISAEILRTKKAITVSDLTAYNKVNPLAVKKKRVSVAGIPLMAREKVIGILYLDSFTKRRFAKTEIDYLNMLSNQAAIALDNILLNRLVKREAKETALLYEVSQSLISTLDFDQLLENILQHLKETFDFLNVSVLLVDEERQVLYTHSSITYSPEEKDLRLRIGKDGITGHVAKTKKMYYSRDVRSDSHYVAGSRDTRSEVCFPLLIGDRLIGVLDVESSEVNGFSQESIRLLSSLSAQIAIAIDNARLYAETKKLSLTDPLTTLSNRRSFDIFIDAEIKRAERYRRTFVVMMIDFDNFKDYNDRYGHSAGDIVLQKFSRIMKGIIRDVDFICRYGGDEFVSILPETDASFALDVAERMRKKIATQKIQPKITLSIGIASFPHDARDKSKLIDLADQACYEAKQRGGNRVLFTFKPKEAK
ncbi:hypothetical protein AMJ83_03580 [candidate division WOR_3 bacterium SM23_42]|uniref:GGDEF domain-containing protein n=1 Tax=candidate division WOR_3 bacterium SM23_42 TaxID=1703779 RepID=A0A0S8FWP2_UNCW3|nr:MAG: hypothetical protein AMJ83_03580 [candidate division WOR_3 bacterium SM23_42]